MRNPVARLLWVAVHALLAAFVAAQFSSERASHALAQASTARTEPTSTSPDPTPFSELRKKSKFAPTGLTPVEAHEIGYELTRNSFGLKVMHTVGLDEAEIRRFGVFLGERQLAWQLGNRKAGIHEHKLLKSLNEQLELDGAPEYLQIRRRELRRMRLEVWLRVPELSTGIERRQARNGQVIFERRMSPLEAYLVSDLLLHQKRFNDDYLRTEAEEVPLRRRSTPPKKPGLYVTTPNPRGLEFLRHMETLAQKKWNTVDAVTRTVSDILDTSGSDQ